MAESQNMQVDAGFSGRKDGSSTGPAGLSLGLGRIVVPKTQTFPLATREKPTLSQVSVDAGSLFIASGRNLYKAEVGGGSLGMK